MQVKAKRQREGKRGKPSPAWGIGVFTMSKRKADMGWQAVFGNLSE
jgi:hypothetical protein